MNERVIALNFSFSLSSNFFIVFILIFSNENVTIIENPLLKILSLQLQIII